MDRLELLFKVIGLRDSDINPSTDLDNTESIINESLGEPQDVTEVLESDSDIFIVESNTTEDSSGLNYIDELMEEDENTYEPEFIENKPNESLIDVDTNIEINPDSVEVEPQSNSQEPIEIEADNSESLYNYEDETEIKEEIVIQSQDVESDIEVEPEQVDICDSPILDISNEEPNTTQTNDILDNAISSANTSSKLAIESAMLAKSMNNKESKEDKLDLNAILKKEQTSTLESSLLQIERNKLIKEMLTHNIVVNGYRNEKKKSFDFSFSREQSIVKDIDKDIWIEDDIVEDSKATSKFKIKNIFKRR